MSQFLETFKTFEGVNGWIAILASIFGMIAFFRTCDQERSIQSIQDMESAMQHRPILNIVKHDFHIFSHKNVSFVHDPIDGNGIEIEDLVLKGIVSLQNSGNSYAKLVATITCDSLIGTPIMREQIFDGPDLKKYIREQRDDFFSERNIRPGENDALTVFVSMSNHITSNGVIHIILIYRNELGAFYDTYYWIKYNLSLPDTVMNATRISHDTTYVGMPEKAIFKQFIHTEITNQDPKLYSSDESKLLKKFLTGLGMSKSRLESLRD